VDREGTPGKAEAELEGREQTVKRFPIRDLSSAKREAFAVAWSRQQAQFVENPRKAVAEADVLVTRLMVAKGYR
jgi:hypothetical protein